MGEGGKLTTVFITHLEVHCQCKLEKFCINISDQHKPIQKSTIVILL